MNEKEELLRIANEKYPEGAIIKSIPVPGETRKVSKIGRSFYWKEDVIWNGSGAGWIYEHSTKTWAEIISIPEGSLSYQIY